jgi:hypothetical protein
MLEASHNIQELNELLFLHSVIVNHYRWQLSPHRQVYTSRYLRSSSPAPRLAIIPPLAPLDLETQAAHAIHLAKCGIKGLIILGSTGGVVAITNKERFQVLSSVRDALEGAGFKDYPIIAGTAT